jgi:hypothetical protein
MIPPLSMKRQQHFDPHVENSSVGVADLGGWQLHQASTCRSSRRLEGFKQGSAAKYWLQAHRRDILAMTAMRSALLAEGLSLPAHRMREENVIEQVAHLLKSGRWHVCEPVMRVYKVSVAQEPAVMPVPRRGSGASGPPPPIPDLPDTATLAENVDQSAIAAATTNAALLGIPLCEECLKKALGKITATTVA